MTCAIPGCHGQPSNGFTICYAHQAEAVAAFVRWRLAIAKATKR